MSDLILFTTSILVCELQVVLSPVHAGTDLGGSDGSNEDVLIKVRPITFNLTQRHCRHCCHMLPLTQ